MPKLDKTYKITTDKDGKVRIVDNWALKKKLKPAGQQFWDKKKVKVKK